MDTGGSAAPHHRHHPEIGCTAGESWPRLQPSRPRAEQGRIPRADQGQRWCRRSSETTELVLQAYSGSGKTGEARAANRAHEEAVGRRRLQTYTDSAEAVCRKEL